MKGICLHSPLLFFNIIETLLDAFSRVLLATDARHCLISTIFFPRIFRLRVRFFSTHAEDSLSKVVHI